MSSRDFIFFCACVSAWHAAEVRPSCSSGVRAVVRRQPVRWQELRRIQRCASLPRLNRAVVNSAPNRCGVLQSGRRPHHVTLLSGRRKPHCMTTTMHKTVYYINFTYSIYTVFLKYVLLPLVDNSGYCIHHSFDRPVKPDFVDFLKGKKAEGLSVGVIYSVAYLHCIDIPFFSSSYAAVCEFLQNNNLLSVIRAHEAQDAGYVAPSHSSRRAAS